MNGTRRVPQVTTSFMSYHRYTALATTMLLATDLATITLNLQQLPSSNSSPISLWFCSNSTPIMVSLFQLLSNSAKITLRFCSDSPAILL